jgi:fucose 4-O-acetylase-like acetyltransferase
MMGAPTTSLPLVPVPPQTMRPPTQTPQRNDFIDYLRGLLIYLVVYGHLIEHLAYNDNSRFYLDPFLKAIYTFHMPLFMAASGFVSFRGISSRPFLYCVRKRLEQIIVPALCWAVLYTLVKSLPALFGKVTPGEAIHSYFLALKKFKPGFWFLYAVLFSSVGVAGLRAFGLDRVQYFVAASAALLLVPDWAKMYYAKFMFPFFCLGYALAKGDQIHLPAKPSRGLIMAGLVAAVVCYWLWEPDTYIYTTMMKLSRANLPNIALRYTGGVIISAVFLLIAARLYEWIKSPMLSRYGQRSLDIYIIHGFLAEVFILAVPYHTEALWFRLLALPPLAWFFCMLSYQAGQGIDAIPVARRLLLGRAAPPSREPPPQAS